jgi:hypothetical protein
MAGLRPWATSSVAPNLSLAPGIGVALGDSTVVARAGSSGVGTGGVAAPHSPVEVSAPVVASVPKQGAAQSVPAVSPGRPLQAAAPEPVSPPPVSEPAPLPEPVVATPMPAAAPEQAATPPLVAAVPSGTPGTAGGPGTSVVGGGEAEQPCGGDEYVITVTFDQAEGEAEEEGYWQAEADIVVQRLGADGSEAELQLRGDLTDVRNLVGTLVSEGNCVQVDVVPPEGGPGEEVPEAGTEPATPGVAAAEPGEPAEAALP